MNLSITAPTADEVPITPKSNSPLSHPSRITIRPAPNPAASPITVPLRRESEIVFETSRTDASGTLVVTPFTSNCSAEPDTRTSFPPMTVPSCRITRTRSFAESLGVSASKVAAGGPWANAAAGITARVHPMARVSAPIRI
jgi:hypothetical protein